VFLDERYGLVNGADEVRPDLGAIEDATPVGTLESPDLDPRIGEMFLPLPAEEQQPADRRDTPILMAGHEAQRLQISPTEFSKGREEL
jgi:hypothetical protein